VTAAEATKVKLDGDRITAIGKALTSYDAFDTGTFVCRPSLFDALEAACARGDSTLSAGIARLAEKVIGDLERAQLMIPKKGRGALVDAAKAAIATDLKVEENLEKDAEALLEQTLRSMGGGAEIDRHKMLRLIKDKLAKERKIVL